MMYFPMFLIFLLVVLMISITPYITRKTESFGVSVPSSLYNHPELRRIRKTYFAQSGILGMIFIGTLMFLAKTDREDIFILSYTAGIFLYLIVTFFIYYRFHKHVKKIKEIEKWKEKKREVVAVDISFYKKKTTYSNGWFFLPFTITVATSLWIFLRYEDIPDKIPMQYDFGGQVVTWAEKSVGTVLMFPLLQLFLTGLFLFINRVIAKSKQQIDPANPEESVKQGILFRRRWSLFTIVSGTLMVVLFSLPPISFLFPVDPMLFYIVTMTLTIAIIVAALLLTITTGQGGSRLKTKGDKREEFINRDDDQYWKLGQFYFNPDDPAVWVEKRFGIGWTVNFARPIAWITLLIILAIPLIISLFV